LRRNLRANGFRLPCFVSIEKIYGARSRKGDRDPGWQDEREGGISAEISRWGMVTTFGRVKGAVGYEGH